MKVLFKNGEIRIFGLPTNAHILFFAHVHNFLKEINYENHPNKLEYPHSFIIIYKLKQTKKIKAFFGFLYEEMNDLGAVKIKEQKTKTIISSSYGEKICIRGSDYASYGGLIMDYIVINELFPGYYPAYLKW